MLSNNFRPKRQRRLSVEKLDGRNLFAALTGTVAIDTNHNDALDVFELTSGPTLSGDPPVAGALVWIDTNGNGSLDDQDRRATTDSNGGYSFDQLSLGQHSVYVMPTPGLIQMSPRHVVHFYPGAIGGTFGLASTDLKTGRVTTLSAAGGTLNLYGLIETIQGEVYATSFETDALYRIDSITGQQSRIGSLGKDVIGDLAYDPMTDTIYGLAHDKGSDPNAAPLSLFRIDRTTATMTAIAPGVGALGVRGTSAMAFDTVQRRMVIFDNNRNEFISYDLQGRETRLSIADGPMAFYNMFFDGNQFLTVIPNASDSDLFTVDVDNATLTFVKKLDKPWHGEAAHALSMFQPMVVEITQIDQVVKDVNFLTQTLELPTAEIVVADEGTSLESPSKAVDQFSPVDPPLPVVLYCIADGGTHLNLSNTSSAAQNKEIRLGDANDTLETAGPLLVRLNAGAGVDIVKFTGPVNLNLEDWMTTVQGVDVIDVRQHGPSTLAPLAEQVLAITDTKKLTIMASDEDSIDLASAGWKLGAPTSNNATRIHHFTHGEVLLDLINDHGWLNPLDPLDVNADGFLTALDALLIINLLNNQISTLSIEDPSTSSALYIDTSGDDALSSLDVLLIINALNSSAKL